jgi:hypothetical protein
VQCEELIAHCAGHGFPIGKRPGCGVVLPACRRLVARPKQCRPPGLSPAILTSLADALGKTGQALEGFKHVNVAARQIQATLECWTESDMNRVRSDLLIAASDPVRRNRASRRLIPLRVSRAQNCGATRFHKSSSPPGATKARALNRAICWRRSTTGLPKASTRRSYETPGAA